MGKSGNPAKRAEAEREPVEYDPNPVDADGVEDFDAYWSEQDRAGTRVRIMGQVVQLPHSLPLRFELEAKRLRRSKKDSDVRHLVGLLFGQDALQAWTEAGMESHQLSVLLAWAPMRLAGNDVSFGQVEAMMAEQEAKGDDPS